MGESPSKVGATQLVLSEMDQTLEMDGEDFSSEDLLVLADPSPSTTAGLLEPMCFPPGTQSAPSTTAGTLEPMCFPPGTLSAGENDKLWDELFEDLPLTQLPAPAGDNSKTSIWQLCDREQQSNDTQELEELLGPLPQEEVQTKPSFIESIEVDDDAEEGVDVALEALSEHEVLEPGLSQVAVLHSMLTESMGRHDDASQPVESLGFDMPIPEASQPVQSLGFDMPTPPPVGSQDKPRCWGCFIEPPQCWSCAKRELEEITKEWEHGMEDEQQVAHLQKMLLLNVNEDELNGDEGAEEEMDLDVSMAAPEPERPSSLQEVVAGLKACPPAPITWLTGDLKKESAKAAILG